MGLWHWAIHVLKSVVFLESQQKKDQVRRDAESRGDYAWTQSWLTSEPSWKRRGERAVSSVPAFFGEKKKKKSIQFLFSDISSVRPYLIFASLHHFVPNNIVCYFLLMIPWFLAFLLFQAIPGLSEKEKAGKLTLVLFSLLSIIE